MTRIALLTTALIAGLTTSSALAQTVIYTFSGTGSGDVAGQTFVRTDYTITLVGDISNREMNLPGVMRVVVDSATISIDGLLDEATFTPTLNVASNMNTDVLVLGNFDTNLALFVLDDPGFADYNLSAPFGPVTDGTPLATDQFLDIATSGGAVSMQSIVDVTFTATPTPGAVATLALAGVLATRRRR
ncbi:MAG: hypothetical protein AAFP26_10220 [Planctomycetota bacterium]